MTRRNLLAVSTAAAAVRPAAEAPRRSLFEMRTFKLRNGPENQRQRTAAYLKTYVSLLKLAGAGPVGVFSSSIGEDAPYLLVLTSFKSFTGMEACLANVRANPDHAKADAEFNAGARPYERQGVRLLAAFPGFPAMTVPPVEGRNSSRIFELRTYELETATALQRKIRMFEEGETAIFVRAGMVPVFFGETLFGPDVPSLTYMLGFDDLAARESTGRVSGADPAWKTLGAKFPDVAVVPKLSITFLTPLPFSDVR